MLAPVLGSRPARLPLLGLVATMCVLPWLIACQPAAGGVHVTVVSELIAGRDFDQLTVTAKKSDGTQLATESFQSPDLKLPATVNFVSGKTVPSGATITIVGQALLSGAVVSTAKVDATLEPSKGSNVELRLPVGTPQPDAGNPGETACDNGLDDDGDGKADCADPDCDGKSCLSGALICSGRRCTCPSGTAGVITETNGYTPRWNPEALHLRSGQYANFLAVAGGVTGNNVVPDVEFVDLATNQPTTVPLNVSRKLFELAEGNGTVYVIGGTDNGGSSAPSLEYLDADGGFTELPFTPAWRALQSAVSVQPGAVILAGGMLESTADSFAYSNNAVEVLLQDGAQGDAGTVVTLGTLSEIRAGSGAKLGTGELFLAGGIGTNVSDKTDLIAPDGTLKVGPSLPVKISDAAVVSLKDGRVMILGGKEDDGSGGVLSSNLAFVVSSNGTDVTVRQLPTLLSTKPKPRAAVLDNGWVYVDDASGGSTRPEWFDPVAEAFVAAATPNPNRNGYSVVEGNGNTVLLVGGGTGSGSGSADGKIVAVGLACQ